MKPRKHKKRPATVVDVANRAGVSLGTVSRVLNNRRGVDPDLRHKVQEAAEALNYVRAANARPASRDTLPILTFVLSNRDFLHPVHARLLQGAEEFCEENGYFVVFKRLDYTPDIDVAELKLPQVLQKHGMADCMILAGTNYPNMVEATERAGVPYVIYGNNLVDPDPRPPFNQVRSDDKAGACEATRYLIRLGHKQICYIGDISQQWYAERYHGFVETMRQAGLEPCSQTVGLSPDNFLNGFTSAEAVLDRKLPITAIFATADDVAFGVWEKLRQHTISVPQDITLIGFGDLPDAQAKVPPLTTVRVHYLQIGRELARMAIEKARHPKTQLPEVVLTPEIVLRGTTWPVSNAVAV